MSYDIWLTIDTGGAEPATVWDGWNCTSNVAPMWRLAGADLADFHGKPASECLPALRAAVVDMQDQPAKYLLLNPENGWGSYETLIPALQDLVTAFADHPKATVVVSR